MALFYHGDDDNVEPLHTCLEDLVANREARPVGLIVRDELDEQLVAGGDDGRRSNLATELSHHWRSLVPTIVNFHIVVPVGGEVGLVETQTDTVRLWCRGSVCVSI